MLDGWRNQQLARNLALSTVEKWSGRLRAFFALSGAYPWDWLPQHADEWFGDLRSVRRVAHSTMWSYQDALRSFCAYVSDPAYDWTAECEQRFGMHRSRSCTSGTAPCTSRTTSSARRSARSPSTSCRSSSTTR